MANIVLHRSDYSIYPGDYVPLIKEEQIREELKHPHKGKMLFPPANITELADSFKIEIAIPGVKREDILIRADENVLSVYVLHKECPMHDQESIQLHEFNYECFERHIILQDNADAEFVSAEYKEGILLLYVPKTKQPAKNLHTSIVVY